MSSVKRNYIYNVIYEVLIIVIPLITSPYISRVLGAEQVGIYTYCYSIVSYFVLFARLGIVNHGSRSIAGAKTEEERNKIFSNTLVIQIFLTILMIILYVLYFSFFDLEYHTMSVIMLTYLVAAAFDVNWFFFGVEQFKITVTRNIIIKLISTTLLFFLVREPSDLWKYGLILGFSQLGGQVAVWPYLKRYVKFVKPELKEIKPQFIAIIILFIPQIAVSLYKMMDKIMIGHYCTKSQLGFYEYASLIVNLPLGFITSLGTVMLPRISALMKDGNNKKSLEYTHYSIIFAVALSTAFAFGLSAIAPVFIPFYFGEEFAPASELLVGLSITLMFLAWANVVRTQYLIPSKKDKEYIISLFCGAAANVVINVLLIPKYQAWGAVIGTIVAEVTVCVLQTFMSRNYVPVWKYIKECIGFIFNGFIMFVGVRLIAEIKCCTLLSLALQVIAGVVIYCILMWLYVQKILHIPVIKIILKNSK